MRLAILFILTLVIIQSNCNKKKNPSLTYASRFRSIECLADNYTAFVEYCYIKAYSRRVTTVNVLFKNLKPSDSPIWVQMILYYRYGTIYREVINTKLIDWCAIMDGLTGHLFLMQTIRQIKSFVGKNIHKCPYGEDIELKNITLDDGKGFDVFPEGIYKSSWITRNKTMDILWRFNASIHVRSPIKESMG